MARYRAISALENFDELPEDFDFFFAPFLFVDLAFDLAFDFNFDFDLDLDFDDFLSFAVEWSFADTLAGFVSSAELSLGE